MKNTKQKRGKLGILLVSVMLNLLVGITSKNVSPSFDFSGANLFNVNVTISTPPSIR